MRSNAYCGNLLWQSSLTLQAPKLYAQSFEEAIADVEHRRLESSKKRTAALIVCGSSLLGLILFLIIPLLLQIEENTRK